MKFLYLILNITPVFFLVRGGFSVEAEFRILAQQNFKTEAEPDHTIISLSIEDENYVPNKTSKILSGPPRPRPPAYMPSGTSTASNSYGDLSSLGSGNTQSVQNHPSISPIDLQLLNAMEKLVGRMDAMDSRVKTLESIVHFLTGKEKQTVQEPSQRGNCPEEFSNIDGIRGKCYYISSIEKSKTVTDWKTASSECAKLGARLAEMLTYPDYHRIANYLAKYTNIRNSVSTDFWTGGLNPGLIWIWSESGQQIDLDKRYWNENDNSSNSPGCLKLSYSIRLNSFFFKGAPCSQAQNFLCEVLDNSVARALASFEQNILEQGESSKNDNLSQA